MEMRADALVDPPTLSDPELSWNAVPGASGYEVQVNFFESFSVGSMVESTTTIGTRFSPTAVLPNNTYFWRVRPLDVNGNPSGWSANGTFTKSFDLKAPTVPGLHIRDNEADPPRDRGVQDGLPKIQHPLFEWDPVPGASGYEIQAAEFVTVGESKFCNWSGRGWDRTPNTAWSPIIRPGTNVVPPGSSTWGPPILDQPESNDPEFTPGKAYCIGVQAIANFKNAPHEGDVLSAWTYIHNGTGAPVSKVSTNSNAPAFVYEAPEQLPAIGNANEDGLMSADEYLAPVAGSSHGETPVLRWKPVPAAKSYWIAIARDAEFTNVIDVALTTLPVYAPRTTLRDESTAYYWVVIPALDDGGGGTPGFVDQNHPRSFHKSSTPPAPFDLESFDGHPRFHWSGALGAKRYKLQVSTDSTFKDSSRELDTVKTASTAYTPVKTYPVDTVLYWRVAAIAVDRRDEEIELNPSAPGEFRRTLAIPATAGDNPQAGSAIPALRWAPVAGAIGYDIHVDQADGKQKDFKTNATAFTPTAWFGTGVWRWQVRAVFPGEAHSAYTSAVPFSRFIPAPPKAQAERTKARVLIRWEGLRNVREYRVEISRDSSFTSSVERAEVDGTEFAPDLSRSGFQRGGTLYWRVAAVDEGSNIGAFSSGTLTLSRKLVLTPFGKPKRGQTAFLRIRVVDGGRRPVGGAKVTVKGAGVKISRKSAKSGSVSLRIRPRSKGRITITATKKGYSSGRASLRVR
jgi:hypothetical protein